MHDNVTYDNIEGKHFASFICFYFKVFSFGK